MDEREPDEACVPLSESVSQRQAMSPLGFFFLPGAPPGRVLATCQEWRSEEKVVSRESKTPSRVAVTCHRTQNGSFAAGRKLSFPGRVEEAARSSGRRCSVWAMACEEYAHASWGTSLPGRAEPPMCKGATRVAVQPDSREAPWQQRRDARTSQ